MAVRLSKRKFGRRTWCASEQTPCGGLAQHVLPLNDSMQEKTMTTTKRRRGNKEAKKSKKTTVALLPTAAPVAAPTAPTPPRQRGR